METATDSIQISINKDRCKGCGYCVEFCPKDAIKMGSELNSKGYPFPIVVDKNKCSACGFCEIICPEFAFRVSKPARK